MKSTAERLSESYCMPKTKEEWEAISIYFLDEIEYYGGVSEWKQDFERCGSVFFFYSDNYGGILYSSSGNDRTEIPVSHFIDLLNDAIDAPWRLLDDGFEKEDDCDGFTLERKGCKILVGIFLDGSVVVNLGVEYSVVNTTVSNYTDLLTLIRLIG